MRCASRSRGRSSPKRRRPRSLLTCGRRTLSAPNFRDLRYRPRSRDEPVTQENGTDEQSRLLSRFGRKFAPGEVIFEAGAPAAEAYLLQEGRVRLIKKVGAAERSLRVIRPGDLFGEQALVPGATRSSTAVALVESSAIVLEHSTFEHLLAGNPAVGMRVLSQLIRRLREAEDQIEVLMLGDSQVKIVAALLQLCQEAVRFEGAGETITLSVSPMELSARVGL